MTQEMIHTNPVCYNHPNRETLLRCNRCDRPICTSCAVLTETGYRCKECVHSQQKIFDTAQSVDFVLAVVISAALSFGGSLIAPSLGFFVIFLAPIAGVIIAEAVRWAIRKRRSKLLFQIAAGSAFAGALPRLFFPIVLMLLSGGAGGIGGLLSLLWPGVYAFLVASTVYYRLSGIQI
jgi:hypothetical protein